MTIGLFGGAFDPPHLGHHQVLSQLIQHRVVDQVWLVPTGQHPFGKQTSSDKQRLDWLQVAYPDAQVIDHNSPILPSSSPQILSYELEKQGTGYSWQTLQFCSNTWKQHTFGWIIGADQLLHFKKWQNWQQILDQHQIWVYPRQPVQVTADLLSSGMMYLADFSPVQISSSMVRQRLQDGESIIELVLPVLTEVLRVEVEGS